MRGMTTTGRLGGFVIAAMCACDGDGQSPVLEDRVLIGEADDATFVAVITDDERVLAYVCDGTGAAATVGAWFVGAHDGAGFSLTHASGARLDGRLDGDAVRGTLTLGPQALEYAVADAEGDAGLFLADDGEDLRGGWIVRDDGSQRGAVLHRTTGDIVAAQAIAPEQTTVVLQTQARPLVHLLTPQLPG